MEEEATRKEYEEMNSWSCVVLRFCAVFFALKRGAIRFSFLHRSSKGSSFAASFYARGRRQVGEVWGPLMAWFFVGQSDSSTLPRQCFLVVHFS